MLIPRVADERDGPDETLARTNDQLLDDLIRHLPTPIEDDQPEQEPCNDPQGVDWGGDPSSIEEQDDQMVEQAEDEGEAEQGEHLVW